MDLESPEIRCRRLEESWSICGYNRSPTCYFEVPSTTPDHVPVPALFFAATRNSYT